MNVIKILFSKVMPVATFMLLYPMVVYGQNDRLEEKHLSFLNPKYFEGYLKCYAIPFGFFGGVVAGVVFAWRTWVMGKKVDNQSLQWLAAAFAWLLFVVAVYFV